MVLHIHNLQGLVYSQSLESKWMWLLAFDSKPCLGKGDGKTQQKGVGGAEAQLYFSPHGYLLPLLPSSK